MIPGGGGGVAGGISPYVLQNQHGSGLDGMDGAAFMGEQPHCHALLYNLSVLKDRVQQLHPLVVLAVGHNGHGAPLDVSGADAIIQEIVAAASSMMYAFQLLCDLGTAPTANINTAPPQEGASIAAVVKTNDHHGGEMTAATTDTIIELDAAELLAKFTHYCQVCGKGFKRDANLRMHMRAHGDEYKSNAALRHAKFQPLKSVICAKNHYKRSHCPKMYVCNRCGRKHFSVLSDLRTHEKHCGDHRWLCSCGTSFSRKDKLVGHLALFAGHQPVMPLDAAAPRGKRQRSASSLASVAGREC
ncbi:hypothetical protein E2562_007270 [Oryza meyeriana var. granulata]|uniref:C2H2-type domain-containing protein n=1 Tax=Oryza meyeriana var. granulata TaxID=110450 RepID=A0A6G1CFA1_9ORYZ|nr:hypothetical protein E2562_007270 [Oryza meyeriana var. granulata]